MKQKITGVLLFSLLTATHALGQSKAKLQSFRLSAGILNGTYNDYSVDNNKEDSGETTVKLAGQRTTMAVTIKQLEPEIDFRSFTPKSDYWSKRTELGLNFHWYFQKFTWIAPFFGYYQFSQTADKTHEDAPPAFVDKTTSFSLGLRSCTVPFAIMKVHGFLLNFRLAYLTTFERATNFGTETTYGAGYAYVGKSRFGLMFNQERQFEHFSLVDDERDLRVRSIITTNQIMFYWEI